MIDIIIFALISVVLLWKLKGLLGKEEETPRSNNSTMKDITSRVKDMSDPYSKEGSFSLNFRESRKEKDLRKSEIEESIKTNLALINPSLEAQYREISETLIFNVFLVKPFYEIVEDALFKLVKALNDKSPTELKDFCSPAVIGKIENIITKSQDKIERRHLVKASKIEILDMKHENSIIRVKVKIESEQLKYTLEGENISSGSLVIPAKFTDILTFNTVIKNTGLYCRSQGVYWLVDQLEL